MNMIHVGKTNKSLLMLSCFTKIQPGVASPELMIVGNYEDDGVNFWKKGGMPEKV